MSSKTKTAAKTAKWIDLCALGDIPVRGARRVILAGVEIGVFRTSSSEVYAINNRCPHKQGPLSEGIVHDSAVTCPLHGIIFDLPSGKARGAEKDCVKTYPIELRGERVFLKAVS